MLRSQRGFTLVELLVGMLIMSMVMGMVGSTMYYMLILPTWQADHLTALNELRFALDTIQLDAVQAQSFTPGEAPAYGYFTWNYFDPDTGEVTAYTKSYSYDAAEGRLLRDDSKEGTVRAIASHIVSFSDVAFVPGDNGETVTVTITVTVNSAKGEATTETGTRSIEMRLRP